MQGTALAAVSHTAASFLGYMAHGAAVCPHAAPPPSPLPSPPPRGSGDVCTYYCPVEGCDHRCVEEGVQGRKREMVAHLRADER